MVNLFSEETVKITADTLFFGSTMRVARQYCASHELRRPFALRSSVRMANGDKRLRGATCKARNRLGQRCKALAGIDGLCTAHRDPERMRELGKKGGSVGRGNAARREAIKRDPSLRDFLRTNVEPAAVWKASQMALAGSSEAARVSASKLLIDSLHEPERERERETWIEDAAREFDRKFAYRLERHRQIQQRRLVEILEPLGLAHLAEEDEIEMVCELAGRLAAVPESENAEHAPP